MTAKDEYERLVIEVRGRLQFDRLSVRRIDLAKGEFSDVFVTGLDVAGRKRGDVTHLAGSFVEAALNAGAPVRVAGTSADELVSQYPGLKAPAKAGIRSLLAIPLFSDGRVAVALMLASTDPSAYSDRELDLARRIGEEMAVAISGPLI